MRNCSDTINVLLVSPLPPPPGGIATWTSILLKAAESHPHVEINHLDTAIRWKSIANSSLLIRLVGGSIQAIRDIVRLIWVLIVQRPEVLHLATGSAQFGAVRDTMMLMAASVLRIPSVIHLHHSHFIGLKSGGSLGFKVALMAPRMATSVIALDMDTFNILREHFEESKLYRIPNMVPLDLIDRIVADHPDSNDVRRRRDIQLAFVGRVTQEKGVLELVEACAPLANVQLQLIGPIDSFCRSEVEERAKNRDEGRWVQFSGRIDSEEVYECLLQSDMVLLPSRFEAFPLTVLEGMALSKPIVATNVGAIAEMINAGGENPCGVCVNPGDTLSLRRAISDLLSKPELWSAMGSNGRRRVERLYSTGRVMSQLVEHWEGIAVA